VYNTNGTYFAETYLKDHLGNVRIAFGFDGIRYAVRQVNSYYPFGMNIKELSANSNSTVHRNEYLYNRKMMQDEMGLGWLDYGARFYEPVLGRWHVVDPAAPIYYSLSPYQYGGNSPINTIDIGGRLFIYVNGFMPDQWKSRNQPEYEYDQIKDRVVPNPLYSPYAPDRNFYTDGPRNAGKLFNEDYWEGIPQQFTDIFSDENMLFTNGSFTPGSSGAERFIAGFDNAQNLIKMLDNKDITLKDGETIKIMGHSQGAAYAAGLATALLQHPVYKHLVEFVVYLSPDQPNQFFHPSRVPGYQFSTMSDWVSSKGLIAWARNSKFELIEGAKWASKRHFSDISRGGHGTDSWVWEVVRWANKYNIPVNVVR
jgi:RHS repeat-associated protein